jgi:hypothetical protein
MMPSNAKGMSHCVKKGLVSCIRVFAADGAPLSALRGSFVHPVLPLLKSFRSGTCAASQAAYRGERKTEDHNESQNESRPCREERTHGKIFVGRES